MTREENIRRFEEELSKVKRPGVDGLLAYIRGSDFYTAPASTKYHLACEGGLLQHSLNVLDALRGLLVSDEAGWEYRVAGRTILTISNESVILIALLHDICKTHFYTVSTRNAKNEKTGKWEKVPYYTVNDKMPLGHGAKSAMIVKEYIKLTSEETYAIWWHMGFSGADDHRTIAQAIGKHPIIWATHTADMMASSFMERESGNAPGFEEAGGQGGGPAADPGGFQSGITPPEEDAAYFQEALPYDQC